MNVWGRLPNVCWPLAIWGLVGLGCNQFVTVYWSKPGAGNAELQRDKDQCQTLQRAVGLDETQIAQCLEAQGWSQVRQEKKSLDSEFASEEIK